MSSRHLQVIVLGDSLAARVAAVLLVKGGLRVLAFSSRSEPEAPWFFSSLHLERLLEFLGGRSCFVPPSPFQVITASSRLDFHGRLGWEEEIRREFPDTHDKVEGALRKLQEIGEELEEAIWESRGLPLLGIGSRWRFAWETGRRRMGRRILRRPLSELLASLPEQAVREALAALFTGLSLTPVDRLTVAEAALLWSGASRQDNVSLEALNRLLSRRYEQFHGLREDGADIEDLVTDGNRMVRTRLKEGGSAGADHFLIAAPTCWRPGGLDLPVPKAPQRLVACRRSGEISPLLGSRVLLGGEPLLRITLKTGDDAPLALIETPAPVGDIGPSAIEWRQRLKTIFPFVEYDLRQTTPATVDVGPASAPPSPFPGAASSLRLGGNALLCSGAAVLPSLGMAGEILVGVSVANHLLGGGSRSR